MGLITLILLFLFFLLFGAHGFERESVAVVREPVRVATVAPPARDNAWELVAGDGYRGVIVSEADAPDFVREAGWDPAGSYWTPSAADVAALEAELEEVWAANAPPQARDEDLSLHNRQYVAAVEAGERLILVNSFCDTAGTDWPSEPVVVADGGACYFQATWDVERAEFRSLTVNGEA